MVKAQLTHLTKTLSKCMTRFHLRVLKQTYQKRVLKKRFKGQPPHK